MFVQRYEWKIKPGHMGDARALIKELLGVPNCPPYRRVYVSHIGERSRMAAEWEWESLAEYDKAWAAFYAMPEWTAVSKKWWAILDSFKEEIWQAVPI